MKFKKKTLIIAGIIIVVILVIGAFLVLKNLNKFRNIASSTVSELRNQAKQKQTFDTVRYFLSKVELLDNRYAPSLIKCLFDKEGNQLYQQWSGIYYPDNSPYEISLVRVELGDKEISLSESCFINEIKTVEDWQNIKTKYNFSKQKFGF